MPSGCSSVTPNREVALSRKAKDFRIVWMGYRILEGKLCIIPVNVKDLDFFHEFFDV
jgi:hypothetical protein